MTVTLAAVVAALLCGVLVHAEPQYYSTRSYSYWSDPSVRSPRLFGIDQKMGQLVVAATNTIFHLSLDLKNISNTEDVTPSDETIWHCKFDVFQPDEACQNFHHIMYFQSGPGYLNTTYGLVPKEETVLICGSNAYHPECVYRNRTDLKGLTSFGAANFCPLGDDFGVTAITESGQMVASVALDANPAQYAMTLSHSPFSGDLYLRTIIDDFLYFNDPTFVSIYEHEESYYLFMTESPVETSEHDTFSRVARVCKNDTGRSNQEMSEDVFVTYMKARMVCRSKLNSQIPYDYNMLQDTVLVNGSSVNSPVPGEHLYGVFTGEINGPLGSALCVYTFNGLAKPFSGDFLIQSSTTTWTKDKNYPPLTCAEGRSYEDATVKVLMNEVAQQEEQPEQEEQQGPIFTMDATVFHKILVDHVTALDQAVYEVFLIAASVHEELELLKLTYVPSRKEQDKSFVSQTIPLNRNGSRGTLQDVGKMELYRTDDQASVYLSTGEGLYVIPISNCTTYPDCRSCVEARDPYCAYDVSAKSCVSLLATTGYSEMRVQDVVNGNSSQCEAPFPTTTVTTDIDRSLLLPSPSPATSLVHSGIVSESSSSLARVPVPTVGDVDETHSDSIMDHIWTIVAAVVGLIVGMVVGLLLFAAIRNREKFVWWHYLSRRHCDSESGEKDDDYCIYFEKNPEQPINNAKALPPRPSTPPLTKLNPTTPHTMRITDSPVLTKYTPTSCHRRSNSSGGSLGIQTGTELMGLHLNNVKQTIHVEESVSNSDRQRFGKNVLCRQISKDYPMPSKEGSIGYQAPF